MSHIFASFQLLTHVYYCENLVDTASTSPEATLLFSYLDLTGAHHVLYQECSTVCTDAAKKALGCFVCVVKYA